MTFFTAEDFITATSEPQTPHSVAELANLKLQREATVVYGSANHNKAIFNWEVFGGDDGEHTHRALLICVEEIEKKPCEHEPVTAFHGSDDCFIPACRKCGVKLKAKWEVVDEQR